MTVIKLMDVLRLKVKISDFAITASLHILMLMKSGDMKYSFIGWSKSCLLQFSLMTDNVFFFLLLLYTHDLKDLTTQ